jgi:hypothetical protein
MTVVIKAKPDSEAVRSEHAMLTHKRRSASLYNFCLPRTYPIFAQKSKQFSALGSSEGWTFIAMEPLNPWMKALMEPVRREFRDHGRILDKWQHMFYQLFDAIMYLQASKLRHGKISFEHVMRHPDSGRLVLIGYDCAEFYSDEDKGEQLKPAQEADIVSAGMMLLEPLLKLLEDSEARRAREHVIWSALEGGDYSAFLECVRGFLPPTVNPIHKNSGQYIMERIAQADKESDPVLQIRRDTVSGLLKLAFQCGTSPGEFCARNALVDGFLMDYIPESAAKEKMLVTEGMIFTGQFTDTKSGKVQKDSLVLLVPDQGLQVFALLDTASNAPVGYYGGVFSSPGQNHHSWSASRCKLHTLPADSLAIDGCPSGPHLFLEDLLDISAPGSLFASSRFNPDDNSNSGNVAIPSRCGVSTPLTVRDLEVRGIMMYSSKFISWGSVYAWPYNWVRISGANAYSMDEIQRRQQAYTAGLPEYTKSIIQRQRARALAAGGLDDAAPS